jgi:membrane-associated protein
MQGMEYLLDIFLHLDVHLAELTRAYGPWIYALLFLIVFAETGLVATPFLPGDSLLFACGALASAGALDPLLVTGLLLAAAVLGDAVNYSAGRFVGPRVFRAEGRSGFWDRALNRDHLDRTHEFFERYGGKAVVLGRFVPIVRTFVPFVAGAVSMTYATFALYNVTGAIAWVGICVGAGYAFGNVPIVRDNFSIVALGIVIVSVLPVAVEILRSRRGAGRPVTPRPELTEDVARRPAPQSPDPR